MTTLIDLDQERARFEAETARQERRLLSKLDTASQGKLSHTFPLPIFPERVQDLIGAVARSLEMEPDAPAFVTFGSLSAAYGSHIRVSWIYETWCHDYCQLVAPSSFGKSPIFEYAQEPIRAIERALQEDAAGAVIEAKARITRLEADRARRVKAYKGANPDELEADLAELDAEIAELETIRQPRIILSDVTPEVLVRLMAENEECASMVSAETPLWDKLLGTSTGRPPDLQAFLSAYSGDFYRCDRITRDSNQLDHPRLAILAATQSATMERLTMRPELMTRGLLPRFTFFVTEGEPVYNDAGYRVPPELVESWNQELTGLGLLFRGSTFEPFQMDADALELYETWHNLFKRRRAKGGDLHDIAPFARKLENKVLRWAGLLHPLWTREPGTLCQDDMERALLLVDFAIENYRAVETLAFDQPPMALAKKLGAWLQERRGQTFRRDWLSRHQHDCRKVPKVLRDAALEELEEQGIVALEERRPRTGRPSKVVIVL